MTAKKTHPAFELLDSQKIASLNLTVESYRHKNTGALHYHLDAKNKENVFLLGFRTVPTDSTGVAHILEHTVLCGSKRYPVRDPFFMMLRRSLNTYMNASTSSDWTSYYFASQCEKDFNNLAGVYIDATFFPNIHQLDFAQEGYRIEFEEPENPKSNLVYKGVVLNEMRGAMSAPVSTLWQTLTKYTFPNTTYHFNSGGEPELIPDLSYDGLKEFYKTHYHPSNSILMTYGDIPAREHQSKIEELAFSHFKPSKKTISIPAEKRYPSPISVEESYPLNEKECKAGKKTYINLSWLLEPADNLETRLKAQLMSNILLDNSASPLLKALETTKLGTAPSPICGLEDSNYEMSFICGLEGSEAESADDVEKLILDVLKDVAKNGVPQDKLEAALHQLELGQREVGGDSSPYGLQLIMSGLSCAIHRGNVAELLNLDPVLEKLHKEIKQPKFLQNLVQKYLLDNSHRVRLILKPDPKLAEIRNQAEKEKLENIKANMSDQDHADIVEQTKKLEARQNQEDDVSILPKVTLKDVPAKLTIPKGKHKESKPLPTTQFSQGTNGLVYQQIITELPDLKGENLELLPYYASCLTELGCGKRDYLETQEWQSQISGGINAYTTMRGKINDVQNIKGVFTLSGKALTRNHSSLTELIHETLHQPRFDEHDRIRELISQTRASLEQSITGSGHSLAMAAACSGMSPSASLSHQLNGLAGIHSLKKLDDTLKNKENIEELSSHFAEIHKQILDAPKQSLLIAEKAALNDIETTLEQCWKTKQNKPKPHTPFTLPETDKTIRQLWTTQTEVNFCAKAYRVVPTAHPDSAALNVLGRFLTHGFIHGALREKGGAYGGGASYDGSCAAFRFYSYRDPRLEETLSDFDASLKWLHDCKHKWQQVEEAILGVISQIDQPNSPAGDAKQAFHNELFGRTSAHRNKVRTTILNIKLDDLIRVAETYLKDPESASIAIVTSTGNAKMAESLELELKEV